jgi:hypothetical protein
MKKYYTLILRWMGVSRIEAYKDAKEFGKRVGELIEFFDAPSTIGTWSTHAKSEEEAIEKAKDFFYEDGWSL